MIPMFIINIILFIFYLDYNDDTDDDSFIDIYYIPEDIIMKHDLDWTLKGCNSVNDYHIGHINLEHLVTIDKVRVLSLEKFIYQNKIRNIKLLKIDTEGHDVIILQALLLYLEKVRKHYEMNYQRSMLQVNDDSKHYDDDHHLIDKSICLFYPDLIVFESNALIHASIIEQVIKDFVDIGYNQVYRGDNTILENRKCNGLK